MPAFVTPHAARYSIESGGNQHVGLAKSFHQKQKTRKASEAEAKSNRLWMVVMQVAKIQSG